VAQVVQLDVLAPGITQRLAPPVADRILMRWAIIGSDEEPSFGPDTALDMGGQHVHQVDEEDRPLGERGQDLR